VALGARKSSILGLILRQGLSLVLVGLSIGAAGALVVGRLMGSFLYQIRPMDPLTFCGVAAVLATGAAAAGLPPGGRGGGAAPVSLLPARRGAGIDRMKILRSEG